MPGVFTPSMTPTSTSSPQNDGRSQPHGGKLSGGGVHGNGDLLEDSCQEVHQGLRHELWNVNQRSSHDHTLQPLLVRIQRREPPFDSLLKIMPPRLQELDRNVDSE